MRFQNPIQNPRSPSTGSGSRAKSRDKIQNQALVIARTNGTRQSRTVEASYSDEAFGDRGGLSLPGLLHHGNGVIRNDFFRSPLRYLDTSLPRYSTPPPRTKQAHPIPQPGSVPVSWPGKEPCRLCPGVPACSCCHLSPEWHSPCSPSKRGAPTWC